MYNLLVTSASGQWKKGAYEYERDRSVREYTDATIAKKYKAMTARDVKELMSLPCLFAYETGVNQKASIGWLTSIKPRGESVRVEYEIDKTLPQITPGRLENLSAGLDIGNWELTRTHWAVKDVDLVKVLTAANILKTKSGGPGVVGKLLRPGTSSTATNQSGRSPVFRLPSGEIESDLVSVMMPFSREFDRTFETIKSACRRHALRCERADDIWDEPEVMQDVFSMIYRSSVVVCDFSGRNPNVCYEAGIAHTLGKNVIPIAQTKDDVPFDLAHLRFIKYLPNNEGHQTLRRSLEKKLAAVLA